MSTATCVQLHKRAEKIAAALMEKSSINTGENVVLLYPPGEVITNYNLTLDVIIFFKQGSNNSSFNHR